MSVPASEVTELLEAIASGERKATPRLFAAVYAELHALAHAAMREESPGQVLQTTALVHEAYFRLVGERKADWRTRGHFFGTAAMAMRRILVDEARRRRTAKRGGGRAPISLGASQVADRRAVVPKNPFDELEALDRALDELGSHPGHERKCRVVELRFFAGLTLRETGELLGVSLATVKRDWEFAKAWLRHEMKELENDGCGSDTG